jgi:anti-anti-sigma factor
MENCFKIDLSKDHSGDTITFYGNIDSEAVLHFNELFHKISENRVVMDFSNVGKIDSMGMALLLRSISNIKMEKKAEVCIRGVNQINELMFKMTGIFQLAPQEQAI